MTGRSFISYAHEDSKEFARRLATDLKAAGADVWLDQLDIPPGRPWTAAIQEALGASERVIVVLSAASAGANNHQNEIAFALTKKKKVIPVLSQKCEPPILLHIFHYINFVDRYQPGFEELLHELNRAEREAAEAARRAAEAAKRAAAEAAKRAAAEAAQRAAAEAAQRAAAEAQRAVEAAQRRQRFLRQCRLGLLLLLIAGGIVWYLWPKPPPRLPPPCESSWPAEGKTYAADRKGVNNGCQRGVLSLERSAMIFTCPDQPNKSVYASIDNLAGADDDGIQLKSGQKYHFKIDGMEKHDVQALFTQWTSQVCKSPASYRGFSQPRAGPGV